MTQKIKIASWNVNSILARLPVFNRFIEDEKPDIVLLQELKCVNENFPQMEISSFGYNFAIHGQKTYNGVAVLSKFPLDDVTLNIPEFTDENSRYVEAVISLKGKAIRVASVYVPNGQEVGSDKFEYKMRFFDALKNHMDNLSKLDEAIFIGGDFNVAPNDIDVFDPKSLANTICFHPKEQQKFRAITNSGWADVFRLHNPDKKQYSWWDYRGNSWQYNKGLRIDFILSNPLASDMTAGTYVYDKIREEQKTSDHAPVISIIEVK